MTTWQKDLRRILPNHIQQTVAGISDKQIRELEEDLRADARSLRRYLKMVAVFSELKNKGKA